MLDFVGMELDRIRARLAAGGAALNKEALMEYEIREFLNSKRRCDMLVGRRYYMGRHDILDKKRTAIGEGGRLTEVENLPNNRITDNCYRRIVQQKVNYLLGKPILVKSEDARLEAALKGYFTAEFQGKLRQLCEDGMNCGIGYMYVYVDAGGRLCFKVLRPYELAVSWVDEAHTGIDHAVRIYSIECADGRGFVRKAEFYGKNGMDTYRFENGRLVHEKFAPYFRLNGMACRWNALPIIPFKYCEDEIPLINGVKSLQDALNAMLSAYRDKLEEDNRNTILIIRNYDGEDLGEFRRNLSTYGAVKVRTIDGVDGAVETLDIKVDGENYTAITELLKRTLTENAKGFDTKALREAGSPNQMNIQSMYADIDLDANGMEAEMQAALEKLTGFIADYMFNAGLGDVRGSRAEIIFNRDVLINENEAIEGCVKSAGLISRESLLAQHPYVKDVAAEMERIRNEKNAPPMASDI